MNVVRFLVEIDPAWEVTVTHKRFAEHQTIGETGDPAWRIKRTLRKIQYNGVVFPFPPADEMPSAGDLDAAICNDQDLAPLEQMYRNVINRNPSFGPPSEIEIFGRYLFRAIVGDSGWQDITAAAKTLNAEYIELALSWDANET